MNSHQLTCAAVLSAAAYAADRHKLGAPRKGVDAAPYINHPLAVANFLASEAGVSDLVVLQAALLHDVLEDTPTTAAELEARFGQDVFAIVQEVTDDKSQSSAERKRLQIVNAARKSPGAAWLKLADKCCNLREVVASPPPWTLERKVAYFDHAALVVRALPHLSAHMLSLFEGAYALKGALAPAEPSAVADPGLNACQSLAG